MEMLARNQKALVLCAVLIAGGWILFPGRRTHILPFDPARPAAQYVNEFYGYMWTTEVSEMLAPDGSAEIVDKTNLLYPLGGCRTISVNPKWGRKKMIARMREIDPGSGTTWGLGWSRDSKAVFLRGNHSGLDCRGKSPGAINLIFTLSDGIAMQAPPESKEKTRKLISNIPAPDMNKIKEITEPEKWLNPFIRVQDRTATVSFRPSGAEAKTTTVQIDALGNELAALPKLAWPYGRIVAVTTGGPQSASMSEIRAKVQQQRLTTILQNSGLAINWWP